MSEINSVNLETFTKQELKQFFNQFDVICTDCDGVLWHDSATRLHPNAPDFINLMISQNKRVYFITNNTTSSCEKIWEKSEKFGFKITLDAVKTPQHIAAQYLKKINFNKKVFVIGFEVVGHELDAVGIEHFGIGPDVLEPNLIDYMQKYKLEENVGAVIVGIDPHISFPKILKAINYLQDPEVVFIGLNSDDKLDFPTLIFPDSGSIIAAIETGSRRKAQIMGKVSSAVCDLIAETSNPINNERTLMIGDRTDVDIVFGKNCGMKTLLVESGMDKLKDLEGKKFENLTKRIPDFYARGIENLYQKLIN